MSFNYTTDVEFDYLFKILIIGESGVGKTALLQRFSQDYFAADYVATIGVDFQIRTIDVDTKRCKLQVWDTAGQDRFKCIVSSFYRGAHGVMICFDITDLESFRNVDNWLEEMKRYCAEQTPIFLVGTKSDLQSKRMVAYSTIKAYVENKGLIYVETSAKTNENIEYCFADFSRTLVEYTNQIKLKNDNEREVKPPVDIRKRNHPVTGGRCMGGNTCMI